MSDNLVKFFGNLKPSIYINFEAAPNAQRFIDGTRLNQKQKKKYFEDIRFVKILALVISEIEF